MKKDLKEIIDGESVKKILLKSLKIKGKDNLFSILRNGLISLKYEIRKVNWSGRGIIDQRVVYPELRLPPLDFENYVSNGLYNELFPILYNLIPDNGYGESYQESSCEQLKVLNDYNLIDTDGVLLEWDVKNYAIEAKINKAPKSDSIKKKEILTESSLFKAVLLEVLSKKNKKELLEVVKKSNFLIYFEIIKMNYGGGVGIVNQRVIYPEIRLSPFEYAEFISKSMLAELSPFIPNLIPDNGYGESYEQTSCQQLIVINDYSLLSYDFEDEVIELDLLKEKIKDCIYQAPADEPLKKRKEIINNQLLNQVLLKYLKKKDETELITLFEHAKINLKYEITSLNYGGSIGVVACRNIYPELRISPFKYEEFKSKDYLSQVQKILISLIPENGYGIGYLEERINPMVTIIDYSLLSHKNLVLFLDKNEIISTLEEKIAALEKINLETESKLLLFEKQKDRLIKEKEFALNNEIMKLKLLLKQEFNIQMNLDSVDDLENEINKKKNDQVKSVRIEARKLIGKAEIEECIDLIIDFCEKFEKKELHSQITQASFKWHLIKKESSKGVIDHKEATLQKDKIADSIINIINKI